MPLRPRPLGALPRPAPPPLRRRLHASPASRHGGAADDLGAGDHYARLRVRPDASPADIKKSFYALSKSHHPDANPSDPRAAHTFSLISESYSILSDPSRRAVYDRDVLRLHQNHAHHHPHHPRGSYSSTNPAGGRPPSGLSRRRTAFRGPPPSFYRNGAWGAHTEKRRRAHDESTGVGTGTGTGTGAGSPPFRHAPAAADDDVPPHFDRESHIRTHRQEDHRRWRRSRRAVGDDDVEFEPQTSLAGHFLIVVGILGTTFLAPFVYLRFVRLGKHGKEWE